MANQKLQTAVFGGGCFWCTEAVFGELRGVMSVTSGYAGGTVPNPSYEAVCGGNTGHAEVIRIEFDPSVISYHDLLEVFFASHDPTTLNRQGNDEGTQYRSAVMYSDETQKNEAEAYIKELEANETFDRPVVTMVEPLGTFYPAESYHQNYFAQNADKPYCEVVINPKVAKVRQKFAKLLK